MGYQIGKHNLVRQVAYEMTVRSDGVASFNKAPRLWPPGAGYLSTIGAELSQEQMADVLQPIRDADPAMSPETIAAHLTASLRKHEGLGIGPHTSAVMLPFPGSAPVSVKFFPLTPHQIVLRTPRSNRNLEANYTPWIVGPGIIKPPTAEVGNSIYDVGGFEVAIEGASSPGRGILSAMTTVPRKPLPPHFRR